MSNNSEDIKKLIEGNLPEATAGVMKEYLVDAEQIRKSYESLKKSHELVHVELESFKKQLKEKIGIINNHKCFEARSQGIDERLTKVEQRENNIDVEIANIRVKEAEKRADTLESLVSKVFGHPKVTVNNHKNILQDKDEYGNLQYQAYQTITDTEETIEGKE